MSASYPAARRVAFPPNWPARIGSSRSLAIYVIYAAQILDITWARFVTGLDHGGRFLSRMFPPNVAPDKLQLLYAGMMESLQIAMLATVFGVALALPLGLAAARNLSPAPLAWSPRADRAVPHLPSGHRRDPVRQGGRLRRARRHAGADRRLDGLPLQAARRGGRGNVDEAGRGGARDRRVVPFGRRDGRAAAGDAALHRLLRLSARFQPAQFRAGRVWSAAAASARRCSPRSSASTTTSC